MRCGWCSIISTSTHRSGRIESISNKLSINHETVRQWVRRAETDAGQRPGLTTDERARMKALERENKEFAERMRF